MIHLHQAWRWDCPLCGERNHDDSAPVEFTPAEADELLLEHGINTEDSVFVTAPEWVTCRGCFEEFESSDDLGID